MTRHRLTDKDFDNRTAVCSIDGPVAIRKVGTAWICQVKKRESSAAWRRANPELVRTGRHAPSAHHLLAQDLDAMTGTCPIDGTVPLVARGRGYMCGTRAAELGVTAQTAPAERCKVCNFWTSLDRPVVDGICTVCLGADDLAPSRTLGLSSSDRREVGLVGMETGDSEDDDGADMGLGGGWHGLNLAGFDAYEDEGWDYEDPSLKTLGPPLAPDDPWTRVMKEERRRARLARERRWA